MKKIIAILVPCVLALALGIGAIFYFVGKKADGEITISEDAMPQLVHVLGEELDLSNGVLSYRIGKTSGKLPLSAEGITVSGYNKNKLGKQILTVSYEGFTTVLEVTVVERMVAQEMVSDYLVGDEFDVTQGRVKITRDDGTHFTVIFNSDKLTLSGFDGTSAGEQTVTATYKNGSTTYTCQFPVTVHAVDSITVKEPGKTTYFSHDDGILLTGGKLTLVGNNGTLTREIPMTHEDVTVSGLDLTAVSKDKKTDSQTLTVTYKGVIESHYQVTVQYSDVSMLKDSAPDYADFVWTGTKLPEIPENLGELALELMEIYMALEPDEQSYVTHEECMNIARAAFVYGMELVDTDLEGLRGGFVIEGGNLHLTCETREGVEAAFTILQDTDSDLYRTSDLLLALSEAYEDETLFTYDEETVLKFGSFALADSETYQTMLDMFDHMLGVANMMDAASAIYAQNGLTSACVSVLQNIYQTIFSYGYFSGGFGQIYVMADAWNDTADVFDLLYEYYYFEEENYDAVLNLTYVRFPSGIDQIVTYIGNAIDQMSYLSVGYIDDPSLLLYYYYEASKLSENVKASHNNKLIELYEYLPVNGLLALEGNTAYYIEDMLDYLRNYSYSDGETYTQGVYYYLLGLVGMPEYDRLMEKYMDIVGKLLVDEDDTYIESAACGSDIEAMLALYLKLSPMQQYNFICALTPGYYEGEVPLAFSYQSEFYTPSLFVNLINNHYRSLFSTEGSAVYHNLINAIELYTMRFYENGMSNFKKAMGYVAGHLENLSPEDQAVFATHLDAIYQQYLGYLTAAETTPDISATLGEWEDDFLALQNALVNVELAAYYNSEEIVSYISFISAFEKAQRIYTYIVDNAPPAVVEALYHLHIYGLVGEENDGGFYGSFDYTYNSYRNNYIYYLLTVVDGGMYDSYVGSALQKFMYQSYDLIWVYLWSQMDEEHTYTYDADAAWAALKAFSLLDANEQVIAMMMDATAYYYYGARDAFFDQTLTANAAAAAKKLFTLEEYYIYFFYAGDEESYQGLQTALTELQAIYTQFAAEDTASFEPLQGMYDYYINMCHAINAFIAAGDLTENAVSVAIQLLDVQNLYLTYTHMTDAEGTQALQKSFAQLKTMYAQLSPEDIESFSPMQDMYDTYVALCEALLTSD